MPAPQDPHANLEALAQNQELQLKNDSLIANDWYLLVKKILKKSSFIYHKWISFLFTVYKIEDPTNIRIECYSYIFKYFGTSLFFFLGGSLAGKSLLIDDCTIFLADFLGHKVIIAFRKNDVKETKNEIIQTPKNSKIIKCNWELMKILSA